MLENGEITPSEYDRLKADLLAERDAPPKEPANLMTGKPEGWYFDPSGKGSNQAYWDGRAWTGQTRSILAAAQADKAKAAASTPIWKKPWFWLVVLVVILVIMTNIGGSGSSSSGSGGNTPADNGSQVGAYVVCQQFVDDRLKSPSSAEFGGPYSRVTQTVKRGLSAGERSYKYQLRFDPISVRTSRSSHITAAMSGGHCIVSASLSDGVFQLRVCLGRPLREWAALSRSSWVSLDMSVPLGKYWRRSPLVFSLDPRCHGLLGSQK